MLYESNWFRLQSLKYTPLIAALCFLFLVYPIINSDHSNWWIDLVTTLFFSVSFLALFLKIKDKLKFVVIGKTQIIIKDKGSEQEYNWLDVEEIKLNRFLALYKLKIKNQESIYFTPYGLTTWLAGDLSDMGVIINKMKKELSI